MEKIKNFVLIFCIFFSAGALIIIVKHYNKPIKNQIVVILPEELNTSDGDDLIVIFRNDSLFVEFNKNEYD